MHKYIPEKINYGGLLELRRNVKALRKGMARRMASISEES